MKDIKQQSNGFNQLYRNIKEVSDEHADLMTGHISLSYHTVFSRVESCIGLFKEIGLQVEDRVVVICADEKEVTIFYIAALCAGVTIVVLDANASAAEVVLLSHAAESSAIFIDEEQAGKVLPISQESDIPIYKISQPRTQTAVKGMIVAKSDVQKSYPAVTHNIAPSMEPLGEILPEHTALILFTSGTTSKKLKAIELSHKNLLAQLMVFAEHYDLNNNSIIVNHLPLHHSDGLNQGVLISFFNRAKWVRPEPVSMHSLADMLSAVKQNKATHLITVPSVLAMIMCLSEEYDDSFVVDSFQFIESTAGYLEEKLWRDFEQRFQVKIANAYGLTETVCEALYCGPSEETRKIGTVGKPLGCEARIVDRDGNPVNDGEIGELTLRGDVVMKGYFRNPEANHEAMQQGWFFTGDLARIDEEGFYQIVGRKKNVIIRGGINIYPEDISETIVSIDGVLDAVTVGLQDTLLGERVVSCVLASDNQKLEVQEIIDYCRDQLSAEKIPNDILIVEDLPRGPAGKVELAKVKAMASRLLIEAEIGVGAGTVEQQVFQIAANTFKVAMSKLNIKSNFASTEGWDSLAHLEFITAIERNFGIRLGTVDIIKMNSLEDAIQLVKKYLE